MADVGRPQGNEHGFITSAGGAEGKDGESLDPEMTHLWSILEKYGIDAESLDMEMMDWKMVLSDIDEQMSLLDLESGIIVEDNEMGSFEMFCLEIIEKYGDAYDYDLLWLEIQVAVLDTVLSTASVEN